MSAEGIDIGSLNIRGKEDQTLDVGIANGTPYLKGPISGQLATLADADTAMSYMGTDQAITFPNGASWTSYIKLVQITFTAGINVPMGGIFTLDLEGVGGNGGGNESIQVGALTLYTLEETSLDVGTQIGVQFPLNAGEPSILLNAIRGLEGPISGRVNSFEEAQEGMAMIGTDQTIVMGNGATWTAAIIGCRPGFLPEGGMRLTFETLGYR